MPTRATVDDILAKLDAQANEQLWPRFDGPLGTFEYHAMRLVAVTARDGGDWGLAFECVYGDFPDEDSDNPYAANVSTYVILPNDPFGYRASRSLPLCITSSHERDPARLSLDGVTLTGPSGVLHCTDAMIDALDLRPGLLCGGCDGGATDSGFVLLVRAYLARYPAAFWQDVTPLFGGECDVVVTCDAFAHVVGALVRDAPNDGPAAVNPSASTTFRSLAAALVSGDAGRFVPGTSNLDWRRWATIPDANARTRGVP